MNYLALRDFFFEKLSKIFSSGDLRAERERDGPQTWSSLAKNFCHSLSFPPKGTTPSVRLSPQLITATHPNLARM
jgi:hypothetical protein